MHDEIYEHVGSCAYGEGTGGIGTHTISSLTTKLLPEYGHGGERIQRTHTSTKDGPQVRTDREHANSCQGLGGSDRPCRAATGTHIHTHKSKHEPGERKKERGVWDGPSQFVRRVEPRRRGL